MLSPPLSLKRFLLLSALFASGVLAQQNNDDESSSSSSTSVSSSSAKATTTSSTSRVVITPTASETSPTSTGTESIPPLTIGNTEAETGPTAPLTGLPTLTKIGIPEYPAPTVPPTQNAPFMNHSSLPDGTVFICVGAILGAFGLGVVIWRTVIACLLHRSVERAAMAQCIGSDKAFPPPPKFYKYSDLNSNPSLVAGSNTGLAGNRKSRGPAPSAGTPSQSTLFFSPTAQAGDRNSTIANNRHSTFLPSGFYASSAAAPMGHSHGNSISMSNLRPMSRQPSGGSMMGQTPPESPNVGPVMGMATRTPPSRAFSSSSVNQLNRPESGRAPSAFLDDLLGDNPQAFPPPGGYNAPGYHGGHHDPRHSGRY
ncbi:hypothetical protein SMACR_04428 [Sordaria macrospora]|uniref:WGS project CABT00000000 data, contig 2.14 n=2 Tax=Sordaria macrospora TaxID=5147 RepID=F7VYY7_SORMK|nr:uncharacterized protein SMAC_04428 [Sordaria macrospora k-hell]KAA8636637.1 hypothetical protein SMACR_04428 [Sordaria macrospora]KAH7633726.1 hypothetical protein B0T09DRAFT_97037 [Sordaria sp. MPI-SDFR-AT-0083]WPJ59895.1 hypothetical protein SMAC4_04428 [Sordaria macrospora]CCC10734.1 unnamed protein product [Sordaria macrospora k-hell]